MAVLLKTGIGIAIASSVIEV